ncbi:TssN family type VI secretion system protein [Myroides sp. WP-1]|uniref:TssN family type VI secretion system protein n=1 Tax=Myroides sp. WP-1 TaxID=2759944 RepID=UPI0015FDECBC|nr:TssN family type VI secretion system protein [Myroides sp. WP-1]MBB1139384.1 TssN family type VI secretion system protein [Myroides sp. WP-1]
MYIEFIKVFFVSHLIIPTILVLLLFPLVFLKKKMAFIKTKELLFYLLISGCILALPGLLGFTGIAFNPFWYLVGSIVYFLFGWIHLKQLVRRFKKQDVPFGLSVTFELLLTLFTLLLGVYLFTYLFDWLSPFKGYALLSASCSISYLIPLLFYYSYIQFLNIPFSIYKTWSYETSRQVIDFDGFDLNKLKVVTVELTKKVGDGNQFRIKAKMLTEGISFGDWFQKVLEDYNFKNGTSRIELNNEEGIYYNWVFYVKRSFFHFRRYIDFEQDSTQNKIKEHDIIVCKRVVENKQNTN